MAKYISPDDFIKSTNGKEYDMDGSYGVQCVDGIKKFAYDVYGEYKFDCGSCGYAYGLWTNYGTNGVEKYFNKHPFSEAKKGDWIIWDWGSKSCKYSHVAMYVDMKTSNLVNSYGERQNGILAFNTCPIYTDGILGVLRPKIYESDFKYQAHVQDIGWQDWKSLGEIAGTTGKHKRMEAIRIDSSKEVYAKAHIQDIGWQDYGKITKDTIIGTTGKGKALECLCLKGDFTYRVHIADFGWTNWTKADGICTLGSVGQALPLEAIQIK